MTIFFEVNGTRYESGDSSSVRVVEERLRLGFSSEVSLCVRTDEGVTASLHLVAGSIGSYAVWENLEHRGFQS